MYWVAGHYRWWVFAGQGRFAGRRRARPARQALPLGAGVPTQPERAGNSS